MTGARPWQLADIDALAELFEVEQWKFLQPVNPWGPSGNVVALDQHRPDGRSTTGGYVTHAPVYQLPVPEAA